MRTPAARGSGAAGRSRRVGRPVLVSGVARANSSDPRQRSTAWPQTQTALGPAAPCQSPQPLAVPSTTTRTTTTARQEFQSGQLLDLEIGCNEISMVSSQTIPTSLNKPKEQKTNNKKKQRSQPSQSQASMSSSHALLEDIFRRADKNGERGIPST